MRTVVVVVFVGPPAAGAVAQRSVIVIVLVLVGVPVVVVVVVVRIAARCHVKRLGPLDPYALRFDGISPVAVGSLCLLEDVD
jgi:hypothetical protein